MNKPAKSRANYIAKISDRAALHEQRAGQLLSEKIHLELSLSAALAKIRELETALEMANAVIEHWKGLAG